MQEPRQKLHTQPPYPEKAAILLVSSDYEDLHRLKDILHHQNWEIARCSGMQDAAPIVASGLHGVVICERELPDGSWTDLLAFAAKLDRPPLLLVMSKQADERLWSEVLNQGGYDVLLKPFDRGEVTRVIGMAWRQWCGPLRHTSSGAAGSIPNWA
jgi:DNA-binding response OmpR family regulator